MRADHAKKIHGNQRPSQQQIIDNAAVWGLKAVKVPRLRGVGVFAVERFLKGDIVVRYAGDTVSIAEGLARERAKEVHVHVCHVCVEFTCTHVYRVQARCMVVHS